MVRIRDGLHRPVAVAPRRDADPGETVGSIAELDGNAGHRLAMNQVVEIGGELIGQTDEAIRTGGVAEQALYVERARGVEPPDGRRWSTSRLRAHESDRSQRAGDWMAKPRTPKGRAREVARRLSIEYPDAVCELDHRSPWELLVATILSAQTTDVRVNMVTPELFRRYPTAADLAAADPREVEDVIRSTGFYQNKTRSLLGMAAAVEERFGGEVPSRLEDLVTLPGVGRKTANVVRSVAFDLPGLPVDTHVGRLSRRLGLTEHADPVKVEHELNGYLPAAERGRFSLRMILHGRRVCLARSPRCGDCVLEDICPSSRLPTRRRRRPRVTTVTPKS